MLDKKHFIEQMNLLLVAFPSWNFDASNQLALKVWYKKFSSFTNERFSYMVDRYIDKGEFNPTIAALKKHDTMPRKSRTQLEHEKMLEEIGWRND